MNGIKLVLSHYPENFEANKEISYSRYKFDIMFSGDFMSKVVVIGAGASGIVAALKASEKNEQEIEAPGLD